MCRPRPKLKRITYEEQIPTWAIPYLLHGDPLESDEAEDTVNLWFEAFEARRQARGEGAFITLTPAAEPSTPYYCTSPAFGAACEVEDYQIVINYVPKYKL